MPTTDLISVAGNLGPGALPENSGEEARAQQEAVIGVASRNPNITSAVEFSYGSSSASSISSSPWIWRINVTNVLVDGLDNLHINDTSSEPQYAASVQWSLEWPGGGAVQDWVSSTQDTGDNGNGSTSTPERPLCIAAYSYRAPANLTSRYSSGDNGNCSSILGDECYASFVENIGTTCENALGRNLEGCEDSWNLWFPGGGGGIDIGNSTWTVDPFNNGSRLMSGDSIYHQNFLPALESNLTNFEAAQTELSILYIGAGRGANEPGHGPHKVMCQVVNPKLAASLSGASGPLRGIGIMSTIAASLVALALM